MSVTSVPLTFRPVDVIEDGEDEDVLLPPPLALLFDVILFSSLIVPVKMLRDEPVKSIGSAGAINLLGVTTDDDPDVGDDEDVVSRFKWGILTIEPSTLELQLLPCKAVITGIVRDVINDEDDENNGENNEKVPLLEAIIEIKV